MKLTLSQEHLFGSVCALAPSVCHQEQLNPIKPPVWLTMAHKTLFCTDTQSSKQNKTKLEKFSKVYKYPQLYHQCDANRKKVWTNSCVWIIHLTETISFSSQPDQEENQDYIRPVIQREEEYAKGSSFMKIIKSLVLPNKTAGLRSSLQEASRSHANCQSFKNNNLLLQFIFVSVFFRRTKHLISCHLQTTKHEWKKHTCFLLRINRYSLRNKTFYST